MNLIINEEELYVNVIKSKFKKFFSLIGKNDIFEGFLFLNTNHIHTFFLNTKIDIVGINNKNHVIYKYENADKNKVIEINNDKKNTSIIVLPNNTSKYLKIGDILSFINEDII